MSEEGEEAELRHIFNMFDLDGSGTIELNELFQVMRTLGLNPTEEEMKEMISSVDDDDSGEIEFAEFKKLYERLGQKDDRMEELEEIYYKIFDKNGDRLIDYKDIR